MSFFLNPARKRIFYLFTVVGLLPACITGFAQKKLGLEADKWAIELSKARLTEVNSLGSLTNQLLATDSLRALRFLDSIEASNQAKGHYFQAHFSMVKADFLYVKFAGYDKYKDRRSAELIPIKEQMMKLYARALDASYHTEDDMTIGWVSFYSAKRMRNLGETGWAVMYSKNGVDQFEKIGYAVEPPVYTELAELLYQVREYDESIVYAKKGIAAWKKLNYEKEYKEPYKFKVRALSTIGRAYDKKMQHDSACAYYRQALHLAKEKKDTVWTGMILGNIGRSLYAHNNFDSAYLLLKTDYQTSKNDSLYDNAAHALEWAAKANLARGNKAAALAEAREAIQLLRLWPNGPYLRDTYYTLTQVFRAIGHYDSAFYYSERYAALHDSLEKEVATSSLAISKAKLSHEISRFNIQKLNREKALQLLYRNIIIAAIAALSLVALLLLNRRRLQEKLKAAEAEQEVARAKEQMRLFTESIIEKTALIEKLEEKVHAKKASSDQQALMRELSRQTILTEEDWDKFKTLFETLHPDFFIKLKQNFANITVAEQRMAALIRLLLTTRQIASMLGISVDSVHKTRQRLRQRLQLSSEQSLEEFVHAI